MPCRILQAAVPLALAVLIQPALGQALYKSITPDGRVVYSDKPPPNAVKVEKSKIDISRKGVVPPSAGEKAALKQMQADRQARESAQDRVRRAEIALHDAEVAAAMGKEPQPNERLGTAGGGQRLTDGYWERQKKLEQAVEVARSSLDKIRSSR
jgi:hypothetical protein